MFLLFSLHYSHQEHTSTVFPKPPPLMCILLHPLPPPPPPHFYCFASTTTTTSNTLHFFPLPPPPHFYCFPSTTPTGNTRQSLALNYHHHPCVMFCIDCHHPTTFVLFSLHRHHHHDQISTGFPPPPSHYLPHIDSILAVHLPPHQPYIDPTSI